MQTGAAEGRVPAHISWRCARAAEVATEPPGRPTGTSESPVQLRVRPSRYSQVDAKISTGATPRREGGRAGATEAGPEIPSWCAGPMEASMETGIGPTRSAEVPAEVGCGSSRAPEVPVEAAIDSTRPAIESTRRTIGSTWSVEVTAQRSGGRSGGVRSR